MFCVRYEPRCLSFPLVMSVRHMFVRVPCGAFFKLSSQCWVLFLEVKASQQSGDMTPATH